MVVGRPVVSRCPVPGRFRARDEQLGFEVDVAKLVKSGGFMDEKGGDEGAKLDPLKAKQIHGSNQTNFITPTNHKKKLGLFLVGIFEIGGEHNKIKLENKV